ncbi:MAG: hypothetical protein KDE25_06050, partial [Novosphingobium sp.]|nr:hypothetical protein [Novosphingobium sp.]
RRVALFLWWRRVCPHPLEHRVRQFTVEFDTDEVIHAPSDGSGECIASFREQAQRLTDMKRKADAARAATAFGQVEQFDFQRHAVQRAARTPHPDFRALVGAPVFHPAPLLVSMGTSGLLDAGQNWVNDLAEMLERLVFPFGNRSIADRRSHVDAK